LTDLIEMNDVVTDTSVLELRIGDRVQMALEEMMVGTVMEITRPEGDVYLEHGVGAVEPPVVTVAFDNGADIQFSTQFLRVVTWRWQALDLKRVP
jgi:hypothetical protein